MAKTQLADIIEPSVFLESMVERTATVSRLFMSGIIERDAEFDRLASGDGRRVDMPFWQDLSGNSEILSDSLSLTPAKMVQAQDEAHRHFRGKAWSGNHVAKAVAKGPLKDPLQVLVNLVGDFWARDIQANILVPTLTGIFATTLAGTHVKDVAIEAGNSATAANLVGSDILIDAAQLLGDSRSKLVGMVAHSKVVARMDKLNLIETEKLEDQDIEIKRFLGKEVVEDDGVEVVAGATNGFKYSTYLFGPGALAHGEGGPPSLDQDEAVETDRDILAGDGIFVSRRHMIIHPRGVQFVGTPAGATPSTAELAAGASWTKAWEDKNIRIVKLVTNG